MASKEGLMTKAAKKAHRRERAFSHKSKVQKFEERRRKSALHKYYKELKKSNEHDYVHQKSDPQEPNYQKKSRDFNPFERAKEDLERRKQEKEQQRAEQQQQKAEKAEAIEKYRQEKIRKFRILQQKTKKGQPKMEGRMQLLYEKIKSRFGT